MWKLPFHRKKTEESSLDFIYSSVKDRVESQKDQVNALENKASSVLTSGVVIGSIGIAFQSAIQHPHIFASTEIISKILAISLLSLSLAATVISSLIVAIPRDFSAAPHPRQLLDIYRDEKVEDTKQDVVEAMVKIFELNEKRIKNKVVWVRVTMVCMLIEVTILVALLIIEAIS
jgi:hypothetical protein